MNEIAIFTTEDDQTQLEVRFEGDTVWLTQAQMSELFRQTKQNISLHINNCFREGELEQHSVVKESLTTAADGKKYRTRYYNLDVIISVGYRVKSKRGTQFRQWATARLREYLVDGYAINQKRLAEKNLELRQLKDGISILHRAIATEAKSLSDAGALASLLERFATGLELLDDYDHQALDGGGRTRRPSVRIEADEYRKLVARLAALTLFIAVSKPEEMETVKKVVISMLNRKGGR